MKRLLLAAALVLGAPGLACAQLAPFTPSGYTVSPLSTTTASSAATMPAGTQSVLVQNTGSDAVFCAPGPTATDSGVYLSSSGGSFIFPMSVFTQIACIDQTSTSTINFTPGSGYAVATSGGGGGGSSVPNPIGVTAASGAFASGAFASGSVASGAFASGSVASGAFASGSLASGAAADGAITTLGTEADTAWTSGSGTAIAVLKSIAGSATTTATNTGSSVPAGTNIIGYTANDPCTYAAKTDVAFASASGTIQLVAGSANKKVYMCSLSIIGQAAYTVNVIEGTGAACVTANEAAVIGSTTAASGLSFLISDGMVLGTGAATIGQTATAANGICLLQSGTAALAGNMMYVQQ